MQSKTVDAHSEATVAGRLPGSTRPRPCDHVIEHEVDDDLVLYDPTRDAVHVLNLTGSVVWWLCDGRRTPERIVAEVARLYKMEPPQVVRDVEEILSQLCDTRLLVRG